MLALASPAFAESRAIELLTGSGAGTDVEFNASSADGSRVFFETTEDIAGTGDVDAGAVNDIYKAEGGTITLLSGSDTDGAVEFNGSADDGSRVFFTTGENIAGTGDSDNEDDVYKAEGGTITLLSGNGATLPAAFKGNSADGSRVFFTTDEDLTGTGGDNDGVDVYKAEGGAITLLTGSGASTNVDFEGNSADGSRVFFRTEEDLTGTGDDSDGELDVYKAEGGSITLLTGDGAATGVSFLGNSADGSRVFFRTTENIGGGDTDGAAVDLYKAEGGSITLLSGSGTAIDPEFAGNSADGSRVFFETTENIAGTGDSDNAKDVYQSEGGTITLLSGSGAAQNASFTGSSADGTRVFFRSDEEIPGTGAGDSGQHIYQAAGGAITLLTGAAPGAAFFEGNSADGSQVYFSADDILSTGDNDGADDVYKAEGGAITLLSGGGTAIDPEYAGNSADGSRVFFRTTENIAGTPDSDGAFDIYQSRLVPDQVVPPIGEEPPSVDTAAPDTTITAGPKKKEKKGKASFSFSSSEPGSTFQCKLDDGSFEPCTSPDDVKVNKGKHTFAVRATDAAGNVDPTPASQGWKVKKKK